MLKIAVWFKSYIVSNAVVGAISVHYVCNDVYHWIVVPGLTLSDMTKFVIVVEVTGGHRVNVRRKQGSRGWKPLGLWSSLVALRHRWTLVASGRVSICVSRLPRGVQHSFRIWDPIRSFVFGHTDKCLH